MIYATNQRGSKIEAAVGATAFCPVCHERVIPKCGAIKVHHWSHQKNSDCDRWSEGETEWHLSWKRLVNPEHCEVVRRNHRADIVGNNGRVIELQHSPISVDEIIERETFYHNMLWIFNVPEEHRRKRFDFKQKENGHFFRWTYPRRSIAFTKKKKFLDFGDSRGTGRYELFQVKHMPSYTPCEGWGTFVSYIEFIETYLYDVLTDSQKIIFHSKKTKKQL